MDDLRLFQTVHGSAGYWWSRTACRGEGESLSLMATERLAHGGRPLVQPQLPWWVMPVLRGAVEYDTIVLVVSLLASVQGKQYTLFCAHRSRTQPLSSLYSSSATTR